MYALQLPPAMVRRLYHLRETHQRGPIRRQVLIAVEQYLAHMEKEYGPCPDDPGEEPGRPERARRGR